MRYVAISARKREKKGGPKMNKLDIQPLTPDECRAIMKKAMENDDQETAHVHADLALCGLLLHLGYDDIVDNFNEMPKWYA